MIAYLRGKLTAAREFANADPIPDDVMALLREVPAEGKAIRRHRRRRRFLLVKRAGQ